MREHGAPLRSHPSYRVAVGAAHRFSLGLATIGAVACGGRVATTPSGTDNGGGGSLWPPTTDATVGGDVGPPAGGTVDAGWEASKGAAQDATVGGDGAGEGADATLAEGSIVDAVTDEPADVMDSGAVDATADACTDCDGSCVDLTSDPLNCAECGHSCLGGACSLSQCQPFAIATNQYDPWEIAVDDQGVYWGDWRLDGSVIGEAPLDGGPAFVAALGKEYPMGIATHGANIYWVAYDGNGSGNVWSAPRDGGAQVLLAGNQSIAPGVAVDSMRAYWGNGSAVMAMPLDGGAIEVFAAGQLPQFFAIDDANLYWTDWGNYVDAGNPDSGLVIAAPLDGGPLWAIASGVQLPAGIAVDSAHVYWAADGLSAAMGSLFSAPLDGGAAVALATGQYSPNIVAVDPGALYWTDYGNGGYDGVWTVSLTDGGPASPLPSWPTAPFAVAVDSTSIYWTSAGAGVKGTMPIMRLAK